MKLIIFTGPPASGKSSIAKFIAKEKKIFFTSKDECKIKLFEKRLGNMKYMLIIFRRRNYA